MQSLAGSLGPAEPPLLISPLSLQITTEQRTEGFPFL